MRPVIHAITPGDHFSPRTGSAIPTVVHGLAGAAARDPDPVPQSVLIDRSTMTPRYDSAAAIEYDRGPWLRRNDRARDLVRGRLGLTRAASARFHGSSADVLREIEPSFVLAHNAPVLPGLLRDTPHRVVLYAHNDVLRSYTRREARRALGDVAGIISVSHALAAQLRDSLPSSLAERIHVVGNGVDVERFHPDGDPDGRSGPDTARPLRVAFVGRVIREKGPDVLLRAARRLARPDVEFVVVGSHGFARDAVLSGYEQELRRLAEESGARVRFEPFVDREALPRLLRELDVFVVPSRWPDPCPLTAGEGMASGVPVIASRIGGLPEVVGDAGILVPPDDPDALATAIGRLADDPAERIRRAEASRTHAMAHDWTWAWSNLRSVLDVL
ncbi:glycosyltransferase family 4 protein [Agromyces kandeliae]|uniref:Glycosyltransferase n=1 Tax=Agromyces kandeliae TaxID=2666141 RepID=A0A6L5R0V9_9MICO|nr:glycosyltransferase family 4 protein [Agromyces kandeliae]MRX43676.1 glycosyltransferase [Agromyces kandeliae]